MMADENITFVKGKVADIIPEDDGGVTVVAENAVTGEKVLAKVDLAILATGMQPAAAQDGIEVDGNGFIVSDADKAMLSAGCAKKAADVVTSTQNSTAAALKAIQASK
jgi:quinone-modifying oxidoreductase subunit QmoA